MIPAAAGGTTQYLPRGGTTPPPTPPPSGGPTLQVTHTGNASRVQIDTTGLWQSQGGVAPTGSTVTMDGAPADAKWTQPTPAAPIQTWLVPTGIRTFALQDAAGEYYSYTTDVYYRGYPWTGIKSSESSDVNATYFGGDFPFDPLGPFVNVYALHNGYSLVPAAQDPGAPAGATYATFCVAPGDDGDIRPDCRAEPNAQDNWTPTDLPAQHLNLLGNIDGTARFIRFDYMIPSSWTAPVVVKNADNTAWVNFQTNLRPGLKFWPNNTQINPATGAFTASATVVNDLTITGQSLSNLMENQGPGTFLWGSGTQAGQLQFHYQPISMGVGLSHQQLMSRAPTYDLRYRTIVEYCPDIYATGNGVAWIVPAGTVTPPRTTAWSSTNRVAPYGVPTKADNVTPNPPYGGGYFRIWEWNYTTSAWDCATNGHAYAVPGTATIAADGTISGGDAGKIFGPTQKCNGATLGSGPGGTTGTVISAATNPPFDIGIANQAFPSGFGSVGVQAGNCKVLIGGEVMRFKAYNNTTKVMTIASRAPTAERSDHVVGEVIAGQQDSSVLALGMNTVGKPEPIGTQIKIPFAAREWPLVVGRSFAAVANVNDL